MTESSLIQGCAALGLALSLLVVGCAARYTAPRVVPPFRAVVGPVVIAHRGGALEAPENTLEAARHAIDAGADWLEADVRLSADDEVVVVHDATLNRLAGNPIEVAGATVAELKTVSVGQARPGGRALARMEEEGVAVPDFGQRFADARIPTLAELLAVTDTRLMIELKGSNAAEALVPEVLEVVYDARAADRVALASFSPTVLFEIHNRDPSLPLVGIVGESEALEAMLIAPIAVLAVHGDLAEQALDAVPAGVALWCWTVYSVPTAERLTLLGVHGIITDIPSAVVEALRTPPDPVLKLGG